MLIPVIAVFDVGKTNKKVFLFDQQYQIVWEQSAHIAETTDADGDPCEDLDALTQWVRTSLQAILDLPDFQIRAINFSGYGASLVNIDEHGQPVDGLANYLKPFPKELRKQFYDTYGPEDTLAVQTASPVLDSLNSALQLYRLKYEHPDQFARVAYSLHLPQYLGYLVNNWPVADLTSVGCHTMLWDFRHHQYHHWVQAEELDACQAPLVASDATIRITLDQQPVEVGVGLHDSSAALIPYLASFPEGHAGNPFVLISTGTWCVSMNPFNGSPLTAEELQYDCLCYMHYKGQPVKASRLFAGYEHELQTKRLADHFGCPPDYFKRVQYNGSIIDELRQRDAGIDPEPSGETGLIAPQRMPSLAESRFRQRDLKAFDSYEQAYHQLMLDLMAQQVLSTALVLPDRHRVRSIYVDGGFGQNSVYMHLLADAFPELTVYAASVPQASALGAALAIHHVWNPSAISPELVSLTQYPK